MRLTLALVASMGLTLWGCARRVPPIAGPSDVAWAQGKWPEMEAADLERGRALVQSKCGGSCHRPPMPSDQPSMAWPLHVAEMSERAGLDPESHLLVERYLMTLSRPADQTASRVSPTP
ncbi:MAG: hypothetical protein R3B48_26605 [Kofleriaceae bacterium]